MQKNKRSILNLISCLLSFIITLGISFLLTPYITNKLGTEAYGFVSLANNFVNYASIATLAINSMASRFVSISYHKKNYKEANEYFNSVLFCNFLLILFLFIPSILVVVFLQNIVVISAELVFFVKILFGLVFINFFLGLINTTFSVATFIKNRVDLSNLRTMESNLVKALLMILLFYLFGANIIFVGVATLCSTVYLLIFNIFYTIKLIPEISIKKSFFQLKKVITIFMSGIWNTVTKLGQVLSDGLDLLVSNWFVSPFAMGQLAISKTFSTCISTLTANLSYVFQPNMTYYYALNDTEKEINEIKFSMKITAFFTNVLLAGIIVFGISLFKLWIPNQNIKIIYLTTLVTIVGTIVGSTINTLFNVFTITNKLKVNSLVTLGQGFLNIIIVFILLKLNVAPGYEIVIISGVSVFTSIIKNLTFTPMFSAKCLKVKITTFYSTIFTGILSAISLIVVFYVISKQFVINTWLQLITTCVICGFIGIVINYFILFNRNQRIEFFNTLKKIVKRRN